MAQRYHRENLINWRLANEGDELKEKLFSLRGRMCYGVFVRALVSDISLCYKFFNDWNHFPVHGATALLVHSRLYSVDKKTKICGFE